MSNLSISIVSLCVAIGAAYAMLVPADFALRGLVWLALALAAIVVSVAAVVRRAPRSMGQVLDDVDREQGSGPAPAAVWASRRKPRP